METRKCAVWGLVAMVSAMITANTTSHPSPPSLELQRTTKLSHTHPGMELMATGDGAGPHTMDGHESSVTNVSVFVWGGTPGGIATAVIAAEAMTQFSHGKKLKIIYYFPIL